MHCLILTAAFVAALTTTAQAQLGPGGGPQNPDTDRDGKVTLAEFTVLQSRRTGQIFSRLDQNKDGKITQAELDAGLGGPGGRGSGRGGFLMRMDADKDGEVTRQEVDGASQQRFNAADTNKDGWLSRGELIMMRQGARGGSGQ